MEERYWIVQLCFEIFQAANDVLAATAADVDAAAAAPAAAADDDDVLLLLSFLPVVTDAAIALAFVRVPASAAATAFPLLLLLL